MPLCIYCNTHRKSPIIILMYDDNCKFTGNYMHCNSLHAISTFVTNDSHNSFTAINPLDSKGNYSATSNNTKLVNWPLMGGLLHLVQRGGA